MAYGFLCCNCGHQEVEHCEIDNHNPEKFIKGYRYNLKTCAESADLGFRYSKADFASVIQEFAVEERLSEAPKYLEKHSSYQKLLDREWRIKYGNTE